MTYQIPRKLRLQDRPSRLVYDTVWVTCYGDVHTPKVAETGADLAIGAALLGELLASGHLTIRPAPGRDEHLVFPVDTQPLPRESLGRGLIEQLRAEPEPLSVRTWLEYLATTDIYTRVAEHMATAGLMHRTTVPIRHLWRKRTEVAYKPVEEFVVGAPFYRMRRWLEDPREPIAWADVFLLGVCDALGLDQVYRHRSDEARDQSHYRQQQLDEPTQALLLHLADAVGSAGTARRL